MQTQKQPDKLQRRGKIPWGRWLVVLAVVVVIIAGSILWIIQNQGPWISILPIVIFTSLGVIIALLQWLFPISRETSSSPLALVNTPSSQKSPINNSLPVIATIPDPESKKTKTDSVFLFNEPLRN